MRGQPSQCGIGVMHFVAERHFWAVDHDHRQAKVAGGDDLGHCTVAPGILGNHNFDLVVLHQRGIALDGKGPPVDGDGAVWEGQSPPGRIDQAQDILMLWGSSEPGQMHPAHRQQHARRRSVQCLNRACHVGHMGPEVAVLSQPRSASQGDERHIDFGAGGDGVEAHLSGKGMGGVDHMSNGLCLQIAGQARRAAKSANAQRQWLAFGPCDPPRQRQGRAQLQIRQPAAKGGGFKRAAKNQEVGPHD